MLKGIVFDMDGVLADTESFYPKRRQSYLDAMGFVRTESSDFTGSNEKAIWETMIPDDETFRHQMMLGYRAYRKLHPIPYKQLIDPQVKPLFSALRQKGLKIAIASSSDQNAIRQVAEAAGVADMVDFTLSGEDCRAHKPDPEIYLRCLQALGLDASEAVAVEDSPAGIASAKRAGLRVLALKPRNGQALDQSEADAVIAALMDVLGKAALE